MPRSLILVALLAGGLASCTETPSEVMTSIEDDSTSTTTGVGPTAGPTTLPPDETSAGTVNMTGMGTDVTTSTVDTTDGEVTATETGSTDSGSSSSGDPPECTGDEQCGSNEVCSMMGECVDACIPWGSGSYDYCLDGYGNFDTNGICGAGHQCIFWAFPLEGTTCSVQACSDACDCPGPEATGDATVTCADITTDGISDCYLSCADDEECPDDKSCFGGYVCMTPTEPLPQYGNCGIVDACDNGTCADVFIPGTGTFSVCVTLCEGVGIGACDPPPPGGTAECDGVISPPMGADCQLTCNSNGDCPMGMACIDPGGFNNDLCMWPPP